MRYSPPPFLESHKLILAHTWLGTLFLFLLLINETGTAVAALSKDGQQAGAIAGAIVGKDGAPMVLVPAGPFLMGSNDGLPNGRPEHRVTLDAYSIEQYEITAGRYQKFVESVARNLPPMRSGCR